MRAPVVLDSCQHLVVLVFWIFATLIGSSSIKLLLNLQSLNNVQVGFRKSRGTRDQIANIHWIIEKSKRVPEKTSISALLTMPKPLTVWITTN